MRPQTVSVTGVAASAALPLDLNSVGNPDTTIYVTVGAGCTLSVQVTADNVMDPAVTPAWFAGPAGLTAITASAAVRLGVSAAAVRINQTAGANGSSIKVAQPGLVA